MGVGDIKRVSIEQGFTVSRSLLLCLNQNMRSRKLSLGEAQINSQIKYNKIAEKWEKGREMRLPRRPM